jgi:hypothetical protein
MPDTPDEPIETPRCSARGCGNDATVDLRWRNPSIHDATRVKHWLACPEHEEYLSDYLGRRNFLLEKARMP